MNCNRCNAPLDDDVLICSDCGERVAEKVQNEKIKAQKDGLTALFRSHLKSPFTLVIAIAMTLIAICSFVNAITAILRLETVSFGIDIWIGIVALIDAFGLLKIVMLRRPLQPQDVNAFKGYLSVQKILNVASLVICEIVAATFLVISIIFMVSSDVLGDLIKDGSVQINTIVGGGVVNSAAIESLLVSLPVILFIFSLVMSGVAAVVFVTYNRILKNFIKYVDQLSVSIENNDYRIQKAPPYVSFLVFGGLSLESGIFALCFVLLAGGAFVVDFLLLFIFGIIASIAFGVYLIFTALLFRKLHRAAKDHAASIEAEIAVLDEISRKTDECVLQDEPFNPYVFGNAAHLFMKHCKVKALIKENGVSEEFDRLVSTGDMPIKYAECFRSRIDEIKLFCSSDLFNEMCNAKTLYREYGIRSEDDFTDCIIDCIIEKKSGELLLVDYKTADMTEEELIEEYASQLTKYRKAIEIDFKKAPSLVAIYSFPLGKTIEIQIPEPVAPKKRYSFKK